MQDSIVARIERDGFSILPGVITEAETGRIRTDLEAAFSQAPDDCDSIRRDGTAVFAARNVTEVFPQSKQIWQQPQLVRLLGEILGDDFGLVRVLFFDKPPERTWTLPWHKDLSIAVQSPDPRTKSKHKINRKAGVPHTEAPVEVLENMLSLRVHLDAVTEDNGPLKVVAGSHQTGKKLTLDDGPVHSILANAGDVLAMRPLVSHCSGRSAEGTTRHRRVLHFEFCGNRTLPDGLEWHEFVQPTRSPL